MSSPDQIISHRSLPIDVVIMAAGKGTRMKSALPKVLHRLGGRALLCHVVDCAAQLSARRAVIFSGHGAIEVEAACALFQGAAGTFDMQFAHPHHFQCHAKQFSRIHL